MKECVGGSLLLHVFFSVSSVTVSYMYFYQNEMTTSCHMKIEIQQENGNEA